MEKTSRNSMFIYISGPYSPSPHEPIQNRRKIIEENITKANDAALTIANKGHFPFVPHTMMHGWEDINEVSRDIVIRICQEWVKKCDAMYIIAPSEGSKLEEELANKLCLTIYKKIVSSSN